ncbi:MAG: NAD(P)/FAD-dependent oxidoreductase [Chloroflexi bacterium]|nr:NAD(P)/FAD-dependent oxidoreductase [Chloroflexota bacterium]
MTQKQMKYDVVIIGSGINGSILGAILARNGLKVVIFEAGVHPKFAIGESMILETSETLRAIASFYGVPEAEYYSSENYFAYIGTSHGVKRHFSFIYHEEGEEQNPRLTLQAVIPKNPYGHELHLYHQDTDYYLTTVAISYGADVLQNTKVQDIILRVDGVEVVTDQGHYDAAYVVDAGGFRSILAERFNLRDKNTLTHSRTIFTHMVDVSCFNDVRASKSQYGIPFRLSEGTLHHIFKGGWMWVIPFNNHPNATNPLCSVGLVLDPRIHPARLDLSPAEEFYTFIDRYPSMRAHFEPARAARGWTRTGRIQYTATHIVGDRFALLGHAAGFVDPLYSKGLYVSFMSTMLLSHLLLEAHKDGDFSAARFQLLERVTLSYVRANDRLIANSFKSWGNYKLWNVYAVLWMFGAYLEYVKLTSARVRAADRQAYIKEIQDLHLVGGGYPEFDQLASLIDTIVEEVNIEDDGEVERAVTRIRSLFAAIDFMPDTFHNILAGKNHLPINKFRLSLLKPGKGFLGKRQYREHFFGNGPVSRLIVSYLREQIMYSTPVLNARRRLNHTGLL